MSIDSYMIIHYIVEKNFFFCRYCLHASITEDVLKFHIKDCSKINGKQTIKMSKKVNMLNSKISKER